MSDLLLVGDIGATSSALGLVDESGQIILRVEGPGANLHSYIAIDGFMHVLSSMLKKLLKLRSQERRVEPSDVLLEIRAAHLAVSGVDSNRMPHVIQAIERGFAHLHIRFPFEITDSIVPSFSSNPMQAQSGILATAGTQACTAAIVKSEIVQRHGGLGWVLGDTGSGTWMGRQILRACAADLDGMGPRTVLTELVLDELGILSQQLDEQPRPASDRLANLKRAVDNLKPTNWSRFAPLHDQAIEGGDPVAKELLQRATNYFVSSINSCRQALMERGMTGEYVLVWAGGVALNSTALRESVEAQVTDKDQDLWLVPTLSTEPITGVARLAAHKHFGV